MSEQNAMVVRQMVDRVLNGRDLAALDQFVAEDFVELDPFPGQGEGREGLRGVMAGLLATFPDMKWRVEEQVSEGDKVVTRFAWTGTHSADFAGVPASGRAVSVKGVVIDRLRDGLLVDSRMLSDDLGMMRQLGALQDGPAA
jgi:steroid delta-isomerase-like uncharacterized protein